MRACLAELKTTYFILLNQESAAFGTLQAGGGPSVHAKFLRFTYNAGWNSTNGLSLGLAGGPGIDGQATRFVLHFQAIAMIDDTWIMEV